MVLAGCSYRHDILFTPSLFVAYFHSLPKILSLSLLLAHATIVVTPKSVVAAHNASQHVIQLRHTLVCCLICIKDAWSYCFVTFLMPLNYFSEFAIFLFLPSTLCTLHLNFTNFPCWLRFLFYFQNYVSYFLTKIRCGVLKKLVEAERLNFDALSLFQLPDRCGSHVTCSKSDIHTLKVLFHSFGSKVIRDCLTTPRMPDCFWNRHIIEGSLLKTVPLYVRVNVADLVEVWKPDLYILPLEGERLLQSQKLEHETEEVLKILLSIPELKSLWRYDIGTELFTSELMCQA